MSIACKITTTVFYNKNSTSWNSESDFGKESEGFTQDNSASACFGMSDFTSLSFDGILVHSVWRDIGW